MSRWIAWAVQSAGTQAVVVICGGYHQPELEVGWKSVSSADRPDVPRLEEGTRTGSYLVPYSFRRLDAFVGYESGMPSPEFYQRVWESGADAAGETMLFFAIAHLREKKQRVSPADSIAAMTLARGLRMLRGHEELARVDVLDGLAAAVLKDALDAPLPWNRRGVLAHGTDPMLLEIVKAFSGERVGKLAPTTPRPPLLHDAIAELERVGVAPKRTPERITAMLTEASGLERSRVLHRLRFLEVPGFKLTRAPSFGRDDTKLSEDWSITQLLEAEPALIEASAYGATLEAAAAAKLEQSIPSVSKLSVLTRLLREAALLGIPSLTSRLVAEVRRVAGLEPEFGELGAALADLVGLFRDDLLGAAGSPAVGAAIESSFERGLWLFEGLAGKAGEAEVKGAVALRDALSKTSGKLSLDAVRAEGVMRRRVAQHDAPPAVRGAAMGFLWSTRAEVDEEAAAFATRSAGRPDTLGDFLMGLFALAREEVLRAPGLLAVIDGLVVPMMRDDFLIAIPSLRLAFSFFPPREKEQIAKRVLATHGKATGDARQLVRLEIAPALTMHGMSIDAEAEKTARRYGLVDLLDRNPEESP